MLEAGDSKEETSKHVIGSWLWESTGQGKDGRKNIQTELISATSISILINVVANKQHAVFKNF